ncbi:LysM domain-containing protein [Sorangium sp. So ce315]|uniref:LysM peptidoglycan-binding domain-containing protein n=1 Tax=Sorangium sp. So ce315 TaxID=3133299 RepID=UPI003F646B9E
MSSRRTWISLGALAATTLAASAASAFPHVVREGETLAQIAERTYGRVQMEQVLVAANALDAGAGVPIMPGLRLEVPALGHHRITAGETWASLAERLLGAADRSDVLALSNDTYPWIPPTDGQEIIVPYNLRYVVGQNDNLLTIAYRFLGKRDKAWMLHKYNHLKKDTLRRGMVILVPLTDLPLTAEGKAEAASAGALVRSEGAGRARDAQRRVDAELPQLASDVRSGRYIDAVARANRLLGYGDLARMQIATVHRHLLEAYVALDATGLAETACAAWREADPAAPLDPIELSPKIVRACTSSTELHLRPPAPDPAPPAADAGVTR